MPRSHELLQSPTVLPAPSARLLLTLVAALAVAGCQTGGRQRANGVETASIEDTASADTGARSDSVRSAETAKPVEPGKLRVSNVMIGRQVGADKRISEPTLRFAPTDTVFVSVATEGTPASSTLSAKWTFPTGKVRDSSSQTIQPKGAERTELHAAPPKGGWPVGSFLVTVYADGDSVDGKTFAVDKPAAGGDTAAGRAAGKDTGAGKDTAAKQ
jgi:hypothetical protein